MATRTWRTAFTPKWRLDRSSARPTAQIRAAAESSGHSPSGRSRATPASIPRNMATPPSLGVGTWCELRRLGTSSRFLPTANRTSSGTNAPATRKATPPATIPVTVAPTPYGNAFSTHSMKHAARPPSVSNPSAPSPGARFTVVFRLTSIVPQGLRPHHSESPQARDLEGYALPERTGRVVEVVPGHFVRVGLVFAQPHHLAGVDRQRQPQPLRGGERPADGFDGQPDDAGVPPQGLGRRLHEGEVRQGFGAGQVVAAVYGRGPLECCEYTPRTVFVVDRLPEARARAEDGEDGRSVEEAKQAVHVPVPLGAVDHRRAYYRPCEAATANKLLHPELRTGA